MATKNPSQGEAPSRAKSQSSIASTQKSSSMRAMAERNRARDPKPKSAAPLEHDADQAFKFLRLLASPASSLVTLAALSGDKPEYRTFDVLDGAAKKDLQKWLIKCEDLDVYFHPNSTGENDNAKLSLLNTKHIRAAFVDIDPDKTKPFLEARKEVLDKARAAAEGDDAPTAVIHSGSGAQLLYVLHKPLTKGDFNAFHDSNNINKRLMKLHSGDESVTNPAALLRLPGTINQMRGETKKGRPKTRATFYAAGDKTTLSNLDLVLPDLPKPPPREPRKAGKTSNRSIAQLKAALRFLDQSAFEDDGNEFSYDQWMRVGMALHLETGGSDDGFAIFDEWSSGSGKYDAEKTEKLWGAIKNDEGRALVSGGSIHHLAHEYNWENPYLDPAPAYEPEAEEPGYVYSKGEWFCDGTAGGDDNEEPAANDWPELDNIFAEEVDCVAFPQGVLPDDLSEYARQVASGIGVNGEAGKFAHLAAMASMIPGNIKVKGSRDFIVGAGMYSALVAKSGSGKTPLLNQALAPLSEREREAMSEYNAALADFNRSIGKSPAKRGRGRPRKEAPTADTTAPSFEPVDDTATDDDGTVVASMTTRAPKEPPVFKGRISMDATTEALTHKLARTPEGVVQIADELGGFFNGFGRYSNSATKDESLFLQAYDHGAIVVERIGSPTIAAPNVHLSLLGGIQPKMLASCFDIRSAAGLLQRFQLCPIIETAPTFEDADERLRGIYFRACDLIMSQRNKQTLELSAKAKATLKATAMGVLHRAKMMAPSDFIRAVMSKMRGFILRVSLALHLIKWAWRRASLEADGQERVRPFNSEISAATVEAAIRYCMDFVVPNARNAEQHGRQQDLEDARLVVDHAKKRGREGFTYSSLKATFSHFRLKAGQEAFDVAISILSEAGWIKPAGNRRYKLNPAVAAGRTVH